MSCFLSNFHNVYKQLFLQRNIKLSCIIGCPLCYHKPTLNMYCIIKTSTLVVTMLCVFHFGFTYSHQTRKPSEKLISCASIVRSMSTLDSVYVHCDYSRCPDENCHCQLWELSMYTVITVNVHRDCCQCPPWPPGSLTFILYDIQREIQDRCGVPSGLPTERSLMS